MTVFCEVATRTEPACPSEAFAVVVLEDDPPMVVQMCHAHFARHGLGLPMERRTPRPATVEPARMVTPCVIGLEPHLWAPDGGSGWYIKSDDPDTLRRECGRCGTIEAKRGIVGGMVIS